ncbi:MAG: arginine--tRNA ligase [bacterium]|nr:arginine--tRNA ligase [bacterium]
MDFKDTVTSILAKELKLEKDKISSLLEVPPDTSMGDIAFPCFFLAKEFKKNPVEISKDLSKKIKPTKDIASIESKGPYLNFFANREKMAASVLKDVSKNYGSLNTKGKALIEHTSINPNASPHVGRARNAIIGDSLSRLLKFHGYNTEVHYFVNDIGKQIAMLVYGCKKPDFDSLLSSYVKICDKVAKDKKTEQEVFSLLNKLEGGNKETKKQFRKIVDVCIKGQTKLFSELGINYDVFDYESDYLFKKETNDVLERLTKTGKVFTDEDERLVLDLKGFDLPMKSPVFVLTRSDKTSLYGLRDIAYTLDKLSKGKDKNIVLLGEDHKLYFKQLSAALSLLDSDAPEAVHYSFVLLPQGKMSTRKGTVILLTDFMNEAREKAKKEILKRNKDAKDVDKLSKQIGYGAIKYAILKVSPEKNVLFDWSQALNFEGESAPYIQYAHARICSILRKHGKKVSPTVNFSLLKENEEAELITILNDFPDVTERALTKLKPHIIAVYSYKLAEKFNEYYHIHQILKADEKTMQARLYLITCIKQVLEASLNILGIEAPEQM